MKKVFENSSQVKCVFTDDGITFCGPRQEVYFPYGAVDSIKLSLLGVLQVKHRTQIGSFAVDHKDRDELKKMIKFAEEARKTAPQGEIQIINLSKRSAVSKLPPEEQLKHYKEQFIQGAITKEEYEARKRQLKA